MASITSMMTNSSSSTSNLYGNRNVLTGLASGMDTESMIENSIVGYKTKIQNLIKQQTKLAWKQDAYREITDKLIALSDKYTSYTSKTNLASNSFFNNAIRQVTSGTHASKVAATGRTDSSVTLNSVKQLATAARYSVSGAQFGTDGRTAVGAPVSLSSVRENKLSGSISLAVGSGGNSVELNFGDNEAYGDVNEFAAAIRRQLAGQTVRIGSETKDASEVIDVSVQSGKITFSNLTGDGSAVFISAASGKIANTLGITATSSYNTNSEQGAVSQSSLDVSRAGSSLYEVKSAWSALSNKTISVTLDGITKTVSLGDLNVTDEDRANGITYITEKLEANLKTGLRNAFGDKVTVELNDQNALSFRTTENNSTLKVDSEVGYALGLSGGIVNYTDTTKTLGSLLGNKLNGLTANADGSYDLVLNDKLVGTFTRDSALESVLTAINRSEAGVKVSYSPMTDKFTFTATETGSQGRIDFAQGLGTTLFGEKTLNTNDGFLVDGNGERIVAGTFRTDQGETKNYYIKEKNGRYYRFTDTDRPVDEVSRPGRPPMTTVYSIDELADMQRDTGGPSDEDISAINAALAAAKEKARVGFTAGQDAILNVTVNGDNMTLTRSSNVVAIDGLSVTLKGTFNENARVEDLSEEDKVSFTATTDADVVVDAVKSFVEQLNDIMKNVHDAYTTRALNKSSSSNANKFKGYEPLTEEEKADMSENEIKNYEEKAKTGLLFGDGDLSRLYNSLRNVISPSGMDVAALRDIGLTTTYENGVTSLKLDEDKLRAALAANPDAVRDVFTKSKENGASSDGLMANLSKTIKSYASTSIGSFGVLVNKAGTRTKSATLNSNVLQQQIDRLDKQIDTWQTKMSKQIDYYTRQFTALEKLMSEMNSQSSALAGMMGGY